MLLILDKVPVYKIAFSPPHSLFSIHSAHMECNYNRIESNGEKRKGNLGE